MGKYVNNNIVNLGAYGSAIDYKSAVSEIAVLLGVGKGDDGKYHLADICTANSISPAARNKPIRSNKTANITDADRAAVAYGFGETPRIEPYTSAIPHAVYEYLKPRGATVNPIEWFRLRDFHGYSHIAVHPLQTFFPSMITKEEYNVVYCMANYTGISGWNSTYCMTLNDMVDSTTREYNIGLLVHRSGNLWLMPTDVKIKDMTSSNFPIIMFARAEAELEQMESTNMYKYVLSDLQSAEGDSYTFAFVATNLGYQTNKTPIAHTSGIPTMRSLELTYGSDRQTIGVVSSQVISGITGYLSTSSWNYTTASDPSGQGGMKIIKPDSSQKLSVSLTAPVSWRRSNVYINVRVENQYGYTYRNGELITGTVNIGQWVSISAGNTVVADIIGNWSYPNEYWFQYATSAGKGRVKFVIEAWRNDLMIGESVKLQEVYVDFPNK